jgi:hypothetical protein
MSLVSCNVQNQLFQQGIMTVKVCYNMEDAPAKAANEKQIAAYSNISGLPDLSTPLMVENVTNLKTGHLFDNGMAVIVPPDTYIGFQIGFASQVGFAFGIEILPSNIAIVNSNTLVVSRASEPPSNQWAVTSQYAFFKGNGNSYDGDMIHVYDDKFGTHSLGTQIADNSYQIRITCTPLLSWTDNQNNTYSVRQPNLTPPQNPPNLSSNLDAEGGGDTVDVHTGTVTGDGTSGQGYGLLSGYKTADDLAVSMVFDVLVVNQKVYNTQTYQFFTSGGGEGLND